MRIRSLLLLIASVGCGTGHAPVAIADGGDRGVMPEDAAGREGEALEDAGQGDSGPKDGTDVGWSPPTCATSGSALPNSAPSLTPGIWKDISPAGVNFAGEPGNTPFTQGIAIDPCNPATIYVTVSCFDTTLSAVWRTTDAGSSWTKVGKFDAPVRVRVDPQNPLHLYVGDGVRGGTTGFWVSNDGGATWTMPANFKALNNANPKIYDLDVYDVATEPSDFNHVLVSFHGAWGWTDTKWNASSGVFESKDGGQSWIVHAPAGNWGTGHGVWFLNNSSTWLLGTQGQGFWRTTDAGNTWSQVTTINLSHGGGQVYYTKARVLYAASSNGVIRSTDDGATWTQVGTVNFVTSVYGDGNRLYTHHAYSGGAAPFFTSPETDGTTWTAYDGGAQMVTDGPFEMAFDSENGILYSGNWGNGVLALKVFGR
jgi:hypothetical protein